MILSEGQKFNGENLLQWNTNIQQLLGSKGLLGYIDGSIEKPTRTETTTGTTGTTGGAGRDRTFDRGIMSPLL